MQEISRSYITIAAFSLKKPFKIPNKTRYSYTGQKAFQRIVHIYLHKKILLVIMRRLYFESLFFIITSTCDSYMS